MSTEINILKRLQDRLDAQGVEVDVRKVAAVILETARESGWPTNPDRVPPWLCQLAMEVTQTSPNFKKQQWPAATKN